MKNFRLLIIALAFTSVFTACKKDDEPKVNPKEEALTGKKWKLATAIINPAILGTNDAFDLLEDCDKDDFTEFKRGGQVVFDQGPLRCDGEPQTQTGTWSFNSDQTKITVNEPGEDPITYDIIELNNNSVKVKYSEVLPDNIKYTFTATYQKM
jgi:hypothetical protein